MAKRLVFLFIFSTLLAGCGGAVAPKMSESEHQYCAILDQHSSELSKLAGVALNDSNNDLRRELSENAERASHQKFNGTLREFFSEHTALARWAVKLDSVRTMNNGMVTAEFKTPCEHSTLLVTVVPRNDTSVISFLASMHEGSYALLTGPSREIGYRNYDESWWSPYPTYISFVVSSIFAVNEDGNVGAETRAQYAPDPVSLAVAAADVSERDRYRRERENERLNEKFMKRLQ
jgi:hypothetical protein